MSNNYGFRVESNTYSGKTCLVSFLDTSTNQTTILGPETIPFDYFPADGTPQGKVFLYFSGTDQTFVVNITQPNPSPTPTKTPTNTPTNTQTPTITPTNTPTPTETPTETPTNTPTPNETPTETPTNTITPTETPTETPTNTITPTETPTNTPTSTITPTVTSTSTNTPTITPTNTVTPSITPSENTSPTPTPTNTETPTNTPTNTITPTITETPTNTPTPTSSPIPLTGYPFNLVALPYNFPVSGTSIMNNSGGVTSGSTDPNALTNASRGFYFNAIDADSINRTNYYSGFTGQSVTITLTQTGSTAIYSGDTNSFKYWAANVPSPETGFVFGTGIGVPPNNIPSGSAVLIQSASTQWVTGQTVYVSLVIN